MYLSRRDFNLSAASATALTALATHGYAAEEREAKKPKLRKAVKYGMIGEGKSPEEKLNLAKKCGFEGVEVDSPSGLNKEEAKAAAAKTGVNIHGVIDSVHWRDTLSSPDETVRAKGLAALKGAIEDAHFFGCDTVLLVPGVVKDEVTYEQCYERSQAEIKKALPLAEKYNVKIAIETVWNNFITTPEQLIQFVDDLKSPYAAAYFDCSNMLKYMVPSATWIRQLGKRMVKFDFKGYSHKNSWCPIGEGDEDWPEVLKALGEIGYDGWATAEVGGGGEKVLQDISRRMDKVLGLA
ncbi:MAG: sugar phosphate isomerase/epimerase [Pirellulaceae bacterium]|nr:sugar phosphate isomerase/epimerase [Pirellulaceae bacterium]